MDDNYLIFKSLFEIWKTKYYEPYFYFQEIFNKVLEIVSKRSMEDGLLSQENEESKYKSLFVPVGYCIENVALIASVLKPDYLRLAFTEITQRFHRKHMHLVKKAITDVYPNIKITEMKIKNDDQKYAEQKIMEWIEEMKTGYGLSYSQMAIDLTGGTKPMSIGAYNTSLSYDEIDAFYIDVDYDESDKYPVPIPGTERLIRVKKGKAQVERDLVFVIMPFAEKYNEIYQWIEESAKSVRGFNLKCLRADKEIYTGPITDKIQENIIKAGTIIAELTENNPNVYYELGLSHGQGKNVIMLTKDCNNLPFDIKNLRVVTYNPNSKSDFTEQLVKEIEYIRRLYE